MKETIKKIRSDKEEEVHRIEKFGNFAEDWGEVIFHCAVTLWAMYLLYESREWSWQDQAFPLIFGTVLIVLLLLRISQLLYSKQIFSMLLVDRLRNRLFGKEEDNLSNMTPSVVIQSSRNKHEQNEYAILMSIWVISLPILIHLFGFVNTLPIWVFAFVIFFTKDVLLSVLVASVTSLGIYVLFILVMGVRFWEGSLMMIGF